MLQKLSSAAVVIDVFRFKKVNLKINQRHFYCKTLIFDEYFYLGLLAVKTKMAKL